jgi:DNA-binding beta-propeller fold protein YncE
MSIKRKQIRALIAGLALLAGPCVAGAQGTWSVIPLPPKPPEVATPWALAVDAAGELYVLDQGNGGRIRKRDAQGKWVPIGDASRDLGQLTNPQAMALDAKGNLYVADFSNSGRIQVRDAQGTWTVIASAGTGVGQVNGPSALAVDAGGSLYVAERYPSKRIQMRDPQGKWSVLAADGAYFAAFSPEALAVDSKGNLYVADPSGNRLLMRDAQGNWTEIDGGDGFGQVQSPYGLAVDATDALYVDFYWVNYGRDRVEKRDAQGTWSLIAPIGSALGQVNTPRGLAVDAAGSLYVADTGNNRVQERDANGNWWLLAANQVPVVGRIAADGDGSLYAVFGSSLWKRDPRGDWTALPSQGVNALATDAAGNLYVAWDYLRKQDTQGVWSVIAPGGADPGQVTGATALAVDGSGNLYVADNGDGGRIQQWDGQNTWSVILPYSANALAVDRDGNLLASIGPGLWKCDPQGDWSLLAQQGANALAADGAGNLYVASNDVRKRDSLGVWSVIAANGQGPGQVVNPQGLAVDKAGHLYVADSGSNRLLEYAP